MAFYSKKQKRIPKKMAERRHCTKRAYQRYGIKLTRKIRLTLIGMIQHRQGVFIKKISNRMKVWKLCIPGYSELIVVYDKERKEIVTFLPN